jgi:hypothetical protein
MAKKKSTSVDSDSGRDPRLDRVVVVGSNIYQGERWPRVYVFTRKDEVERHIPKKSLSSVTTFCGFDEFETKSQKDDVVRWADVFEVDLDGAKSKVQIALRVWDNWLNMAKAPELDAEMRQAQVKQSVERAGREGKLSGRIYRLVELTDLAAVRQREQDEVALPPQAKICLRIMRELCSLHASGRECLEAQLREKITERAEELHTRQDPWRIFQYYRARMIHEKFFVLI